MTIVVPVKNRHQLIVRCLDSIKAQLYRPLNVIVVDNGSTDNTAEAVTKWIEKNVGPGFEARLIEETTPGPSAARNAGLNEVESRLMMFFDSDDTMEPHHVETIMKRFGEADYPDLVYFRTRHHNTTGKVSITHKPGRRLIENHLVHSILSTQGYACETALVRRAGAWNRNLLGWEDMELGLRLYLEARKRSFIGDINVDVYNQEDSVTGKNFSSKAGNWEKALDEMEKDLEKSLHKDRKRLLKYIDYRRAILAAHYRREGNREMADSLMKKVMESKNLNAMDRLYLKTAFIYTALGGRGASIPARFIF